MFRPRVIPILLLHNGALYKTKKFSEHKYIGDPINAVKIFNDLNADELAFLDIDASKEKRTISLDFVKEVGEEANMPFSVGGGIRTIKDIQNIIASGAEKVIINTYAAENPDFINEASENFGTSTITVCMDIKNKFLGKNQTWIYGGTKATGYNPIDFAKKMEQCGAGELIIQSINHDGMMGGYDIDLIKSIANEISIPVVALGGASSLVDLKNAYHVAGATGLAAGSIFVFKGNKRGVLINYPEIKELQFN